MLEKDGMTADNACCACGGGVTGTCKSYFGFKTYDGFDCGWFMQTAQDDGSYLDDPYYGYDDRDTRCSYWDLFNDTWGMYDGVEVSAIEACCVCGGGIRSLDYPSYMPIERPSTTPSSSPTATPTIAAESSPTATPSTTPSSNPSQTPSQTPSIDPVRSPTRSPVTTPVSTTSSGFVHYKLSSMALMVVALCVVLF